MNEWTISTLKEHYDAQFKWLKDETAKAFANSEKAIAKEEEKQTAYKKSHNDLLDHMGKQYAATLPRTEADARFKALEDRLVETRDKVNGLANKGQGMTQLWGYIVAGVAVLAFVLDRLTR